MTEKCPLTRTGSPPAIEQYVCARKERQANEAWGIRGPGEKLAQDLKDLGTRGDDELKERWRNLYGTEPPG
jgi:hypothetical protein